MLSYDQRLERGHRILEKYGATPSRRTSPVEIGGEIVLIESELRNERLIIHDSLRLPERLHHPLARLERCRESWIDLLDTRLPQQQGNIVVAVDGLDRFSSLGEMRTRALYCTGPHGLVHRVVSVMLNATRRVASYDGDRVHIFADGVFEEAGFEIDRLLRAAMCSKH